MNKFYNPKLYKAPPKKEMTEEERIAGNFGAFISFAQVQQRSFGEYEKAGQEATGVIAMMDMMKQDVEKEVQEMKFNEKDAQSEYEEMVKAAGEKRHTDSSAVQEKQAALAGKEEELHKLTTEHKSRSTELMDAKKVLAELHEECDWLLQNYDTRKEARANEIDAMKKAKAVLSGADFSLLQTGVTHHLRRKLA